jgi:predicted ATPase with chaperone activity
MFASVCGMSVEGLSAQLVRVEVDISNGLPAFDIVGLPAVAVKRLRQGKVCSEEFWLSVSFTEDYG